MTGRRRRWSFVLLLLVLSSLWVLQAWLLDLARKMTESCSDCCRVEHWAVIVQHWFFYNKYQCGSWLLLSSNIWIIQWAERRML